jgi:hypothetical protein
MLRRHEDHSKDHFDLLPFIAILMCMLGCLLLVTISIAALSMGPGAGEGWMLMRDSQNDSKKPILIEWDGAAVTFHWKNQKLKLKWAPTSQVRLGDTWYSLKSDSEADRPEFDKLLDELANQRQTHYALFAVRPSGFASFNRVANEFRSREIDVGYEPISQEKPVRLLQEKSQP